jgi:hypothetical protein
MPLRITVPTRISRLCMPHHDGRCVVLASLLKILSLSKADAS